MATNPPPLFTVDSLASYLGLKPETIRRWRATTPRQGPPAVKIGNQVRWRFEDVDVWLQENRESWGTEDGPLEEAGEEFGPGAGEQPDRP